MQLVIVLSILLMNCLGQQLSNSSVSDDNESIERPCPIYDTYCIRKYFSKHGKCSMSCGPVPEPYNRAQTTSYLPNINLTITATQVELRGLNGRIEEFYINRNTDNLVLSIEFRGFSLNTNYSYFRFHRMGREPIVTTDFLFERYQSLVITMIIPNTNDLKLEKSEVFTYVNDVAPTIAYGPGIANSTDPTVQRTLLELNANLLIAVREGKLTDAVFYAATFVQYNLCDFGLKVF